MRLAVLKVSIFIGMEIRFQKKPFVYAMADGEILLIVGVRVICHQKSEKMDKRTVITLLKASCETCSRRWNNRFKLDSYYCKREHDGSGIWSPITNCGCEEWTSEQSSVS